MKYLGVFFSLAFTVMVGTADAGGPEGAEDAVCCVEHQSTNQTRGLTFLTPKKFKPTANWVSAARCVNSAYSSKVSGLTITTTAIVEVKQKKCFDQNVLACCEIVAGKFDGMEYKPANMGWMPRQTCDKAVEARLCAKETSDQICCAWKSATADQYLYNVVIRSDCARVGGAMVQNERSCPDSIPGYRNVAHGGVGSTAKAAFGKDHNK